nr:hypothetical protein CFP56_35255 [Quercus suber]
MKNAHREKILEECSLSLLGHFLTTRPYNQRAAKELLRFVWKFGTDLRIVDVGDGLFQFKFTLESQLKWLLYFSHSLTSKPATHHHFLQISLENPIRNPIHSILSKLLKVLKYLVKLVGLLSDHPIWFP